MRRWIVISGVSWLLIGAWLLFKGLMILSSPPSPLFIGIALLVGFVKGRFVLSKTVRRLSARIAALPQPIRLASVYPRSYWMLLGGMMLLGFMFRWLPTEWRGFADVAIGSALMNGALLYFRAARLLVV